MQVDIKFKYYEDSTFILSEGRWINLNKLYKKDRSVDNYIKGLIEHKLSNGGQNPFIEPRLISTEFNAVMRQTVFYNTVDPRQIDDKKIIFTNGYYDRTGFHKCSIDDIPFSPFQIERDYNEDVKGKTKVEEFLDNVSCGDKDLKTLLIELAGAAIIPKGLSAMAILHSAHSTSGKGTYIDLLNKMLGKTLVGQVDQSKFIGDNKTSFPLSTIKGKTLVTMDELPIQLNSTATETIKEFIDSKQFIAIERKGVDTEEILNVMLWLATTNKNVKIHNVDDALKRRIIWVPFDMNKDEGPAVYTTNEIEAILKDEEGLDWLTAEACKAVFTVIERPGIRNEKFTIPQSSSEYWDAVDAGSIAEDIIASSQILTAFIETKSDFIANEDLKIEFDKWKLKNMDERITLSGFKKELVNYFSAKRWGSVREGRKAQARGILISWAKVKVEKEVIEEREFSNIDFGELF